jgi:hypothetical protein
MTSRRTFEWASIVVLCGTMLATALADEENGVEPPWMVSEASLPAGFPGPGPAGEVIVKTYPSHRLARTAGQGANGGFMQLFRHIDRNDISMTAPVVVSIDMRGAYDEGTVTRGLEQLRMWLAKHPEWTEVGPPRSLAYNSPFVPGFAKYSEVQIPVVPRADDGDRKPE